MHFGSAPASVSRKPPAVSVTILAKLSNFSAIADAPRKKNAAPARQPVLHAGQTPAERFPDNAIPATSETPAERFSETAETERTKASPAPVLRHGRGNGSAQNSRRLLLRRIVLAATRQQTVLDRSHRRTPLEKDREVLRIVVLEAERNLFDRTRRGRQQPLGLVELQLLHVLGGRRPGKLLERFPEDYSTLESINKF